MGFKSVSLVRTINQKGQTNLAVFSSLIHLGSDPTLIELIKLLTNADPYTDADIQSTRINTFNHIRLSFLELAHQTSAKYPDESSGCGEMGLTPELPKPSQSPFGKESEATYPLTLLDSGPFRKTNKRLSCLYH